MPITATTALCGHAECDPYRRRNSAVDEGGDVVVYRSCGGHRYLFRDNVDDGLIIRTGTTAGTWSLTRVRDIEVEPGLWDTVLDGRPVCTGAYEPRRGRDSAYVARRGPTSRVFLTHDTQYGLFGKLARWFLIPSLSDKC